MTQEHLTTVRQLPRGHHTTPTMLSLSPDTLSHVLFFDSAAAPNQLARIAALSMVSTSFMAATQNPLLWRELMLGSWRQPLLKTLTKEQDWRTLCMQIEEECKQQVRLWEYLFLHQEHEPDVWQKEMKSWLEALGGTQTAAYFLWRYPIHKQLLGEYLGSTASPELRVCVLEQLELKDTDVVQALQQMFEKMSTRTSTALNRLVRALSVKYHGDNMLHMASPNVVHTIMYAALMLNTDMYNDNVKPEDKMTKGTFVQSVLRMREGDEPFVPIPVIERIYNRILQDGPFKINGNEKVKQDTQATLAGYTQTIPQACIIS
eukprot:TRINITY_DN7453_c0_g1_i3.p1 TRINITY_DN7453_c0_g1~~TRINITY_DN7453_c0_g1_i3.p1  ORF type:complete len:318 (+),score=71.57 TRINITY_DN7453_c0_g1_i3:220-1173(+)